ncbi:MAG TPA: BT_3928 family protein [Flavisolibacter sp.]|nr:BT_3928 family protein [Flavisolibacter sp.]
MRIPIRIIQAAVGILFIISGLVKAIDPLGLAYKMQEFFELWSNELSAGHFFLKGGLVSLFELLHQQALPLSICMITLEVFAGVALLLGWKKNFILWLLLSLIIFFTFLTGYAYLSGKFTNCGCFGDCLPITPLTSFTKDIILLVLIIALLLGGKYIVPLFSSSTRGIMVVLALGLTLLLQWYVLNYLPLIDCLSLKKGNNIAEQMKPPPGAVPDSFAIRFIYEKGGKKFEFAPENLPADFNTYKFIDRKDQLIRKGNAEPALKGFSLTGLSGQDSTEAILSQPLSVLLFFQDVHSGKWINQELDALKKAANGKGIPLYIVSPSSPDAMKLFKDQEGLEFFNCDFTVVRIAARTEPAVYILKKGTIWNKYSSQQLGKAGKELASLQP